MVSLTERSLQLPVISPVTLAHSYTASCHLKVKIVGVYEYKYNFVNVVRLFISGKKLQTSAFTPKIPVRLAHMLTTGQALASKEEQL